jgi:hypothetical protein
MAAGLEGLDDDHTAAAMRAGGCERLLRIGATGLLGRRWDQVQEFAHGFHRFGAIGAGEQAVVADPVDKMGTGYATLWNAFKRITAGYSPTEKLALYSGTAKRLYRLD